MDSDRDIKPVCAFSELPDVKVIASEIEEHYLDLGWCDDEDQLPSSEDYLRVSQDLIKQVGETEEGFASPTSYDSYLLNKVELK